MRSNPVEIKHWEILQTLGGRNLSRGRVERRLYAELVETHGMCPWLAAAGYLCGQKNRHRRPLLLAYLNADHSIEAKETRQWRILHDTNLRRDGLADFDFALARVPTWIAAQPHEGFEARYRSLVKRLHHWETL